MRLVVDPAARRQQVDEPAAADQVVAPVAGQRQERLVDLDDRAVGRRREVAARRAVVELLGVVVEQRPVEAPRARPRAAPSRGRRPRRSPADERVDGGGGRVRRREVGAVPGRVEHHEGGVGHVLDDVLADRHRRDDVLGALQDQGRHRHLGEVGPVVGEERDPGEPPGDVGVGAAEALGQLGAELGARRGCP